MNEIGRPNLQNKKKFNIPIANENNNKAGRDEEKDHNFNKEESKENKISPNNANQSQKINQVNNENVKVNANNANIIKEKENNKKKEDNDSISDVYSFESNIIQVEEDFKIQYNKSFKDNENKNNRPKNTDSRDSIKTESILNMEDEF